MKFKQVLPLLAIGIGITGGAVKTANKVNRIPVQKEVAEFSKSIPDISLIEKDIFKAQEAVQDGTIVVINNKIPLMTQNALK